MDSGKIVK